jgi:hypothetical protein
MQVAMSALARRCTQLLLLALAFGEAFAPTGNVIK